MSREITAEQAYQEDLLEYAYRTSGLPVYVARADAMMATFVVEDVTGNQNTEPQQRKDNIDLGDRWGLIEDADPRVIKGREDAKAIAYERRVRPVELKPKVEIDPANPVQ